MDLTLCYLVDNNMVASGVDGVCTVENDGGNTRNNYTCFKFDN